MSTKKAIIIWKVSWILIIALSSVRCDDEWDMEFMENEEDKRIQFGEKLVPYGQAINMDENIMEDVAICYLTYTGNTKPIISEFVQPNSKGNQTLGVVFNQKAVGDPWSVNVTKQQDYESIVKYQFKVQVRDREQQIYLFINNLDDNPPIIQILENPCVIDENYKGKSNCTYLLSDEDGIMNEEMTYTIKGQSGLSDIFVFQNDEPLKNGTKSWKISLHTLRELDFEKVPLYLFDLIATDYGGNNGSAKIVVKVKDLPDMPPMWMDIFIYEQYDEKTNQTFIIKAIDGDFEVNNTINYILTTTWTDYFSIEETTGVITCNEIDRDALQQEMFNFQVTAFEVPDRNSTTSQNITIIINDINDHIPNITVSGDQPLKMKENTTTTLELDIKIVDLDLLENGTFSVALKNSGEIDYTKAFQIIPNEAYQNWSFKISTVDITLLDYEDPNWQDISFDVEATELANSSHVSRTTIYIELENLNDEFPIFEQREYVVDILEDIKVNQPISIVKATDRDIGDVVTHSLVGQAAEDTFHIDPKEGLITTKIEKALDYELQKQVIVNVKAQDSLLGIHHDAYAQLRINVIDVNDEPPTIVQPPVLSIKENQKHGTLINKDNKIIGRDVDTYSFLNFSILWEESYATKNNQNTPREQFEYCVDVETERNDQNRNEVYAMLTINERIKDNTPDYEHFDTLFLVLKVEDTNQTILPNSAEVRIVINIEDLNDNEPIFDETTIQSYKSVIEKSDINRTISRIVATDEDGPKYNKISYSITPINGTPDEWIAIHPSSGELYVNNAKINADLPIWNLIYKVTASDGELYTEDTIKIELIDKNDQMPILDESRFIETVYIDEKSDNNFTVQELHVTDQDRDKIYNSIWFTFGFILEEENSFFSINLTSGVVYVDKKSNKELDRDEGTENFTFIINYGDNNYREGDSTQNKNETKFTIILNDINDKAPVIETNELNMTENLKEGELVGKIIAKDKDKPGTLNTAINFTILNIEKGKDANKDLPQDDLFSIAIKDLQSGEGFVTTNYDLREFHGTYNVLVMAYDHGEGPQTYNQTVQFNIAKYNFEAPKFIFPPDSNTKCFLSTDQILNKPVVQYNGSILHSISASDQQQEKWDLSITIDPETNPGDIFGLSKEENKKSTFQLILKKQPNYETKYTLKLIADCKCLGDEPFVSVETLDVRFINNTAEPFFEPDFQEVSFTENTTGLFETKELRKAVYNQLGEEWNILDIYYNIIHDNPMSTHFSLGKLNNLLNLTTMLDREELANFTIKIQASQKEAGNPNPDEKSVLKVVVKVIDVNDNPPNFEEKSYSEIVTASKKPDDLLLSVLAIDLDEDDDLTYSIVENSLKPEGSGIDQIKYPFYFKPQTPDLHLNFSVQNSMSGFFTIEIEVKDLVNNADNALVTVHVVSDKSKSIIKFKNGLEVVEARQIEIRTVFDTQFTDLVCNIENIQRSVSSSGETLNNVTEAWMHFIKKDTKKPLDNSEFQKLVGNVDTYIKLQDTFSDLGLTLLSLADSEYESSKNNTFYILIGISASVVILSLIVTTTLIWYIRNLLRRIQRLTNPSYLPEDVDNTKVPAIVVPNTNRNANIGSNPVFSEEKKMPDLETKSIGSADDDLIGIEDNPNFAYENKDEKLNHKDNEEDC